MTNNPSSPVNFLSIMVTAVAMGIPGGPVQAAPVPGATNWFTKNVKVTFTETNMVVESDGVPTHQTGQFPNRGNPNRISAQRYTFRLPLQPKAAAQPVPLGMHPFGVAVNGIVFDPGAAEWWRGDRNWQYEPLAGSINLGVDTSNAHVQPNGAYHYHGLPTGLIEQLTGGKAGEKMVLVGFAADGFPIYGPWGYNDAKDTNSAIRKLKSSYRVKKGARQGGPGGNYDGAFVADYEYVPAAGDLDECNGRFGTTQEFPKGTFYYHLTAEFPFIPRLYRGTPDESFFRKGPPGGPGGPRFGGPGGPKGPPQFPPPPKK